MDKKTKSGQSLQLAVMNPSCAAIDVGSMMMMVSYSDEQGNQHLLEVDAYTESLEGLAITLKQSGVTRVAMEATGVYWVVVYEILEKHGFSVTLVNAKHFKNVDAQKTDVKDCQWLHQLHAHGLLRASHIPQEIYRELKSYLHERSVLQKQKSDTLNRIHKLLTQMNIKVQHLISDIEGVSAMKLLRGIASGISNPEELLSLMEVTKLKSSKEDLLKSLKGLYKKQYIMILQNSLEAYDFFKGKMKSYEILIENVLKALLPADGTGKKTIIERKKSYVRKNHIKVSLMDIGINSALTLLQLHDVNLARAEDEVGREVVLRLPIAERNVAILVADARTLSDAEGRKSVVMLATIPDPTLKQVWASP